MPEMISITHQQRLEVLYLRRETRKEVFILPKNSFYLWIAIFHLLE